MTTANVVTTQTGTGFTIDVTNCNLLSDITVKDFYVLHGGVLYCDGTTDGCSSYTKVTSTSLQYTGTALGANTTVEVRRKTPRVVYQVINYGNRFVSSTWNTELDRVIRRAEEADLNGVGPGTQQQIATPDNTAYPTGWSTDTVKPPTRQAAYNIISTLAPTANPTFTGTVTVPTPSTADSSTKAASTAYVQNNLVNFATLTSPALNGAPTTTTPSQYDNTTKISSTAFVQALCRPNFALTRSSVTTAQNGNNSCVFPTQDYDSDGTTSTSTISLFTCPTGGGGKYTFQSSIVVTNNGGSTVSMGAALQVNSTNKRQMGFNPSVSNGGSVTLNGACTVNLSAGDVVGLQVQTSSTSWTFGNVNAYQNYICGERIGA